MKSGFLYRSVIAITALVAIGGQALGAPASGANAPSQTIVLVSTQGCDSGIVDAVYTNISRTFSCAVSRKTIQGSFTQLDPEVQEVKLQKLMGSDALCMIALVDLPDRSSLRSGKFPKINAALVNLAVLRCTDENKGNDVDCFTRRAKRETVRVAGRLLGLQPCFNPRCAMRKPEDDAMKDSIGTNLCPPCARKAERLIDGK